MNLRPAFFLVALASVASIASAASAEPRLIVTVEPEAVVLSVESADANARFVAREHRPDATYAPGRAAVAIMPDAPLRLPRHAEGHDRLYSAFSLAPAGRPESVGELQWATRFVRHPAPGFRFLQGDTIKGLNCLVMIPDGIELGVDHVVENIVLAELIDLTPGAAERAEPEFLVTVSGRPVAFHAAYVRKLDQRLLAMTRAGMDVQGILNNTFDKTAPHDPAHPLLHPTANRDERHAILSAFNVVTPEGLRHYIAAVEFIAARYTRADAANGWLSGLVVGNEIQMHTIWNNLGPAPRDVVVKQYALAFRLAALAGLARHPDFRVSVSMTHHWVAPGSGDELKGLSGIYLLDTLAAIGRAQGDFPWSVAFHPYPQNLFQPAFWRDRAATFSLDTPLITFRNIEVLEAYLARPELLYEGKPRRIALTEQGFHGPAGTEGETLQAAALAYAYEKVSRLKTVTAFHLHRHVDHPKEGGLMLGLWTHAEDEKNIDRPGRKKLAWDVFRAFGTSEWPAVSAFALPIAGLASWADVRPLPASEIPEKLVVRLADGVVYDLAQIPQKARLTNSPTFGRETFLKSAGWLADSLYHHPPAQGVGRATFTLRLPPAAAGKALAFSFGTGLAGPSTDGVVFRVRIGGKQVFEHLHTTETYTPHSIALDAYAGREIKLTLETDRVAEISSDWAHWVEPQVTQQ